jgi:3-oxoadipate enol-lactonase
VRLGSVDDGGDGAPLLLSGSIGTTTEMWVPVLPLLAGFRTIRVDHPGHGGSAVASMSLDEYGRAVVDTLDELEVEQTHVCGLSLGGAVALWLALNVPDRVGRLVLAGTRAKFGDESQWHDRAATVRAHGTAAIVDATLDRWFTAGFTDRDATRRMIEAVDAEGYARCCELLASIDLRDALPHVPHASVVVRGDHDPSADASSTEVLLEGLPNARLVVIPHAAHMPVAEQPAAFAAAVNEHLAASE